METPPDDELPAELPAELPTELPELDGVALKRRL
jgi:hypothetical protein